MRPKWGNNEADRDNNVMMSNKDRVPTTKETQMK